jgi:hypothetical protein
MFVRKTDAYVRVPKKDAIEMPHQRSCRCNVVDSWKTIRRELALDERKCFFAIFQIIHCFQQESLERFHTDDDDDGFKEHCSQP